MALGSCVLTHQAANSTQDPSSAPASVSGSSTVVQGGGQRLAVYLNQGAKAGDTLTLSLSGALGSLHLAKARDGSGLLMAAVQTSLAAAYDKVRSGALTELMFRWVGVYNVDPAGRGLGANLASCRLPGEKTCKKTPLPHTNIGVTATKKISTRPISTKCIKKELRSQLQKVKSSFLTFRKTNHEPAISHKPPHLLRSLLQANLHRVLLTLLCAATLGAQASESMMNRYWSPCDVEWDRIKSLPPLSKAEYEHWLARKPSVGVWGGSDKDREADYYYFMARIPFVIGQEDTPSTAQRDAWLQQAADLGHKAAKAALMRLRYLGPEDAERLRNGDYPKPLENPRATRTEYLLAAREAAEAGDPEFATVMMDTALNTNRRMHCQDADATKVDTSVTSDRNRRRCDPQDVTQEIETKKWAEIAARGGNPNAKGLLCRKTLYGTFPEQGFTGGPAEAFPWCFATTQTACMAGSNAGLLEEMYDLGKGTAKNPEKAAELRKRYPMPPSFPKTIIFPLITR